MGVEFYAHITRLFTISDKITSIERSTQSLQYMGVPVLMGGLTTFISVVVLAGTQYPLFNIYYFRMYFITICLEFLYGLLLLPVLLSFLPEGFAKRGHTLRKEFVEFDDNTIMIDELNNN